MKLIRDSLGRDNLFIVLIFLFSVNALRTVCLQSSYEARNTKQNPFPLEQKPSKTGHGTLHGAFTFFSGSPVNRSFIIVAGNSPTGLELNLFLPKIEQMCVTFNISSQASQRNLL